MVNIPPICGDLVWEMSYGIVLPFYSQNSGSKIIFTKSMALYMVILSSNGDII